MRTGRPITISGVDGNDRMRSVHGAVQSVAKQKPGSGTKYYLVTIFEERPGIRHDSS